MFAFDFTKTFDSVNHYMQLSKLKQLPINHYIFNWVRDSLSDRQQRVLCVMGYPLLFLPINRGVPQGTILEPILLLIMVNTLKSVDNATSLVVKYADDITLSTCRSKNYDCSDLEVNAVKKWAVDNQMTINLSKTKDLTVRGRSKASLPQHLQGIKLIISSCQV